MIEIQLFVYENMVTVCVWSIDIVTRVFIRVLTDWVILCDGAGEGGLVVVRMGGSSSGTAAAILKTTPLRSFVSISCNTEWCRMGVCTGGIFRCP